MIVGLVMDRIEDLAEEFKPLAQWLVEHCAAAGVPVRVTSGRRTIQQQNMIYAQGRTAKGRIVTNAKGGSSPHNFGMAVDVCPIVDGKLDWNAPRSVWNKIGAIGKSLGLTWGGDFKSITDLPHFEYRTWRTVQAKWRAGKIEVA